MALFRAATLFSHNTVSGMPRGGGDTRRKGVIFFYYYKNFAVFAWRGATERRRKKQHTVPPEKWGVSLWFLSVSIHLC